LDPNYAPALAGLAKIEAHIYRNHEPTQAHLRLGEQLAQQALALDHELPSAHVAMGFVYGIRYDYVHAAQEIREGIRLKSDDPWFWDQLSWALAYLQPPDNAGAEQAAREAIRLLPNFPVAYFHLGRALLQQQRYQEAVTALNRSLELDPASAAPHFGLSQVYLARGNTDLALAEMDKTSFKAYPLALIQTSSIYAVRGEKERALVELEKALLLGYRDFAALDSSPYLASLRADPRYQQLLGRYRK
jgi:tetratricopeptide (TPR) repeat protein